MLLNILVDFCLVSSKGKSQFLMLLFLIAISLIYLHLKKYFVTASPCNIGLSIIATSGLIFRNGS